MNWNKLYQTHIDHTQQWHYVADDPQIIQEPIWLAHPKFPKHRVSLNGLVMSLVGKPKILKSRIRRGYPSVQLGKGAKAMAVHRLVAEIYCPNPLNKPQVNHINGDKFDNRSENLEWVTPSENQIHATRVLGRRQGSRNGLSKLSEGQVEEIRCQLGSKKLTHKEIAAIYGVGRSNITAIHNKKSWAIKTTLGGHHGGK